MQEKETMHLIEPLSDIDDLPSIYEIVCKINEIIDTVNKLSKINAGTPPTKFFFRLRKE